MTHHSPVIALVGTLLLFCLAALAAVPVSPTNRFKRASAIDPQSPWPAFVREREAVQHEGNFSCFQNVDVVWHSRTDGSVFTTPRITDLYGLGRKVIIVSAVHYIDVFFADDGTRAPGWPFGLASTTFLTDPILYDLDGDGLDEIVAATAGGDIIFLSHDATIVDVFRVPKLKVKTNWFDGIPQHGTDAYMNLEGHEDFSETMASNEQRNPHRSRRDGSEAMKAQSPMFEPPSPESSTKTMWKGFEGWLSDEGVESLELFLPTKPADQDESILYSQQYEDYHLLNPVINSRDTIFVDAHILATPVIADLDEDGNEELVIGISYYFDETVVEDPDYLKSFPVGVDLKKYIADGVVCFDLHQRRLKWATHLDITTHEAAHQAFIVAAPTIARLDPLGKLNVLVPTSVGFVHVLDHIGRPVANFATISVDSVMARVVIEDLTGDGILEIIVVDVGGNIMCYNNKGDELWEGKIAGVANHHPVIVDIDGDGKLDVIVTTDSGHVWAMRGHNGMVLPGFPVALNSPLQASPIVLVEQGLDHPRSPNGPLSIVVGSTDGHIFFIDNGCISKVDMGEGTYSALLADDLRGDGILDLVYTSTHGGVWTLATERYPWRSLTWSGSSNGQSVHTARNHIAVFFSEGSKDIDAWGREFEVGIDVIDAGTRGKTRSKPYSVRLLFGKHILVETETLIANGRFMMKVPCPTNPYTALLRVELISHDGRRYYDTTTIRFHHGVIASLSAIVAVPFIVACLFLVFKRQSKSQDHHQPSKRDSGEGF